MKLFCITVCFYAFCLSVSAQQMDASNLIKAQLASPSHEDVAVLKNPIMYGEGNPYSGGSVVGALQIVAPLADYMFDIEGTIMRFSPGTQERIRFHLNCYGWSTGGTVKYDSNPIKAYWDKALPDLNNLPVTIGNIFVDGSPKTTITLGDGGTNWGSYVTITIDKVYLTNMAAHSYLFDSANWTISRQSQVNSTDNVVTQFVNTLSVQSNTVQKTGNEEIAGQKYFNDGIGLGTTDLKGYKLAVNGNIRAREIKVEATNWPDYVFDESNKTLSLKETEKYIRAHKHLPEVPSAKEVEANGVSLGEMNKILLKKVEELTLHLIEKDKEMKQINDLQNERLIAIEKLLKK